MSQRGDEEQREIDCRRGRQMVWFKEEGEGKETDLGLYSDEVGAGRKRMR